MASIWPLTGRAYELGLIAAAIAPDSEYAGVVIGGEAGVGKTRLAREAVTRTDQPSRWIAASTSAQSIPLGALASWAPRDSSNPVSLTQDVLGALAGGGDVVVAVDDAHLLDELSVFVVQQLVVRRLARVIVTVRNGEPVSDTVTALWRDGHLRRLDIQPLSEAESIGLVEAALGGPFDPIGAQQLWRLTRGNALYLRHIVESELAEGRVREYGGTWSWTGDLIVSSTLGELISSRMGSLPEDVANVVDILAVGEPLSAATLSRLVEPDALERAEARRLTSVEATDEVLIRLAHPMYGEARKAMAGPMRLRRLRGLVASALAKNTEEDARAALRRAVLILDSDLDPDPAEMLRASEVAIWLADVPLAVRLSHVAVSGGGGWPAEFAHATNLMSAGAIDEADTLLAGVAARDAPEPVRLQADFLRVWGLQAGGRPDDANAALVAAAGRHTGPAATATLAVVTALVAATCADIAESVEAADIALSSPDIPDLARMLAMVAKVVGLAERGRLDELRRLNEQAHVLAKSSTVTLMPLTTFTEFYAWGLRLAGCVEEADRAVDSTRRLVDGPAGLRWVESMASGVELYQGHAAAAAHRLESVGAGAAHGFDPLGWVYRYGIDLVMAYAISGQHERAALMLTAVEAHYHAAFEFLTPQRILAAAWVHATQGWLSGAVADARRAAEFAASRGQLVQEVTCLHVATRFGDATTAPRLAELATTVDGPRVSAAAAHAAALATGDGDGLDAASRRCEEMGDLLAAADAAAHASEVYARAGRRNEMRVSVVRARALADACGSVKTPALAKLSGPTRLTEREREIIAMAAQGLSNREIAEHLSVSVRTVEGHLYRASVRMNAGSREELAAMLRDKPVTEQQ